MHTQNNGLKNDISRSSGIYRDPAGREIRVISEADGMRLAAHHKITPRQVHLSAMHENIWPLRYVRNRESLSPADQMKLLQARVATIGAGGLGGYVLQLLARIGIGTLVAADPDCFEESNLNRQALARTETLGRRKTEIVAEELARINPGVDCIVHPVRITAEYIDGILQECDVAVDALDNPSDRQILQASCARLHIPIVHGALAGFEGRVMTILPEDAGLGVLQPPPENGETETFAESLMGTPAIAPAFIASMQAMEVIKIVIGRGRLFRRRMFYADLENGRFDEFMMAQNETRKPE